MKWPTPEELRSKQFEAKKKKDENWRKHLRKIVKSFLETQVLPAMLKTEFSSVNIPIPMEAYGNLVEFYKICRELIPKEYDVKENDDGAGRYNTLYVGWSKK
jgi:hypothetical protein